MQCVAFRLQINNEQLAFFNFTALTIKYFASKCQICKKHILHEEVKNIDSSTLYKFKVKVLNKETKPSQQNNKLEYNS